MNLAPRISQHDRAARRRRMANLAKFIPAQRVAEVYRCSVQGVYLAMKEAGVKTQCPEKGKRKKSAA